MRRLSSAAFLSSEIASQCSVKEVIKHCEELIALVCGPEKWMYEMSWSFYDSTAISIALDLKLGEHVTIGDTPTSLEEIEIKTGADRVLISKFSLMLGRRHLHSLNSS